MSTWFEEDSYSRGLCVFVQGRLDEDDVLLEAHICYLHIFTEVWEGHLGNRYECILISRRFRKRFHDYFLLDLITKDIKAFHNVFRESFLSFGTASILAVGRQRIRSVLSSGCEERLILRSIFLKSRT